MSKTLVAQQEKDYEEISASDFDANSADVSSAVKQLIAKYPVIMFSKTWCPFCIELKRTLATYRVAYAVFEINTSSKCAAIHQALFDLTQSKTVPNLFVNGTTIGGCTDFKSKEFTQEFITLLAPYIGSNQAHTDHHHEDIESLGKEKVDQHLQSFSLFYFPETINGRAAQLTGVFTTIVAVLCVIFYRHAATQWAVLGLAIDFVCRVVFGGSHSVIGLVSMLCLVNVPPRFVAGAPKQFAAMCGVFFSTLGAGLYLSDQRVGGAIVIALLAGAAFLEGAFDFCVGCLFFGYMIRFGLVPPNVYRPYLNARESKMWAYAFMHETRTFDRKACHTKEPLRATCETVVTPIDVVRKIRPETEFKLQDVDPIRHTTIDAFAMPMALMTLSYLFEVTHKHAEVVDFNTGVASMVLAILAVIVAGLLAVCYLLRMCMYPQKVWKEWQHPVVSNSFSCVNILLVLFGLVFISRKVTGGLALIWIGAIGQMILTLVRLHAVFYRRLSSEFWSPALLMTPVGNLIAAIGFGSYAQNYPDGPNYHDHILYAQLARWWFSLAVFWGLVFFVVSFTYVMQDAHSEVRSRPSFWVYLASAAAVGPAYLSIQPDASSVVAAGSGIFFQCMWCIAFTFCLVLSSGYISHLFFAYTVYDHGLWTIPFAYTVCALNTVLYAQQNADALFKTLAIVMGAIACVSMATTGLHTATQIFDRGAFWLPKPKWGPVSCFKLTHEAFRVALPRLQAQIEALHARVQVHGKEGGGGGEEGGLGGVDLLVRELRAFFVTFALHSRHEDEVMFPALRRFFPHLEFDVDAEHDTLHTTAHLLVAALDTYAAALGPHTQSDVEEGKQHTHTPSEVRAAQRHVLDVLQAHFAAFSAQTQAHLRHEENTITVVARKYLTMEHQKQITAAVYELSTTPSAHSLQKKAQDDFGVAMAFTLRHLPPPAWQSRYVRTFLWACPHRAQELGLVLYRHVDSSLFTQLAQEMPELIPRGLPGHLRMY